VRRLRDRACRPGRLTRQEVARALGVDRRSLSGWVSGNINPRLDNVKRLTDLVDLVEAVDDQHPGSAREILLQPTSDGRSLLALFAAGRTNLLHSWRLFSQSAPTNRGPVPPTGTRARPPLYQAAAQALREGRLTAVPQRALIRPQDFYDQDLADAELFAEPSVRRGRQR
jgi:transcriptional regulator with XRE-family HTH domain